MIVTSLTVRVPAKINLQLAVGPLRPDGYHGLVTVFHAIGLFDMVTVAAAEAERILRAAGVHPGARGESLTVQDYAAIAAARGGTAFPGGHPRDPDGPEPPDGHEAP